MSYLSNENSENQAQRMKKESYDIYQLPPDKEKRLWNEAYFVFDTSALLDLYSFPEPTRVKFFNDIIKKIKDRVWMPGHVQYEFLKNRNSVIRKTVSENYLPLRDDFLKSIGNSLTKAKNQLEDFKQRTSSPRKHPYIEGDDIDKFQGELEALLETYKDFESSLKTKISDREKEILDLSNKDSVLERIENLIPAGADFTTDELMDIVEEGKLRYEFKIPPGFEDAKEKDGMQIFADLIIWKQILFFAKHEKKPVIFICNDAKADWWNIDKVKKLKSVKEELIKEFNDASGCEFWMYDQHEFLHNANTYLSSQLSEDDLAVISTLFGDYKDDNNVLTYKCTKCKRSDHINRNDLGLEFRRIEGARKDATTENEYQASAYFKCNYCDNDIHGIFRVYEYPKGVKNSQAIDLEGANVVRECALHVTALRDQDQIEIEGLEQIIFDHLMDETPEQLMNLSSNTQIEEVNDIVISNISLEKDGTVNIKGAGSISVELNYGPSSDGATMDDSYPFEFEANLKLQDEEYELEEMLSLEVDTSSFYE